MSPEPNDEAASKRVSEGLRFDPDLPPLEPQKLEAILQAG